MESEKLPQVGDFIVMEKIAAASAPFAPTPKFDEYKMGEINQNMSLPIEYQLKGFLLDDIEIGAALHVDRRERNGVVIQGETITSPLVKIQKDNNGFLLETINSVYRVQLEKPLN